jgi:hypothetical protein
MLRVAIEPKNRLFDDNLSINYDFITNQFDTQSPLVLVFNVFKHINNVLFNIFSVYDLRKKKVVKECKIKNFDLLPKYIFKKVFLLAFDYQNNRFLLIDMNSFEIFYKINTISDLVKQISDDKFILHEFDNNEKKIYLVKISIVTKNSVDKKRLFEWKRAKWFTINYKNLIHQEDDIVKVFDFESSEYFYIERFFDDKIDDEVKAYSSNNGSYLVLKIDDKEKSNCRLIAFRIENKKYVNYLKLEYDLNRLKDIMVIDNYLLVNILENDTMTRYIKDLKNENNPIKHFRNIILWNITARFFIQTHQFTLT